MKFLSIENLNKKYSDIDVLDNITFRINKGEFVSVIGPNGCGKTTLLNLIAGIDRGHEGNIKCPANTRIGFIFQNPNDSVLPWKTVAENIRLDNKNLDEKCICRVLDETGILKFKDKYPYQLSGGMKQLLAISRAFVYDCNLLLLDEPFASLDFYTGLDIRDRLIKLWEKKKPTVIFVSHNIEDAILLSDKIIILSKRPGKIKKIIKIGLQRPRNPSLVLSTRFLRYKKIILETIKNESLSK